MQDEVSERESAELLASVYRMKLAAPNTPISFVPLVGGVSSEIVRVDTPASRFCIKRALSRLKVKAKWEAPLERNEAEVAWMKLASALIPDAVPRILGEDHIGRAFAMSYLDPSQYAVWKSQLHAGVADIQTARDVGTQLCTVHAGTANRPDLRATFSNEASFFALRLEPYFLTAAEKNPDCAEALEELVSRTNSVRIAVVHGDVSPKNILVGRHGPVFLDAECATYGDPAFDVAFCLSHLLLKCVWVPENSARYIDSAKAFLDSYREQLDWENKDSVCGRSSSLLAALLLARIDGKSPVEYITEESHRDKVRQFAKQRVLAREPITLESIFDAWRKEFV